MTYAGSAQRDSQVALVVERIPLTYSLGMATTVHGIESFKDLVG